MMTTDGRKGTQNWSFLLLYLLKRNASCSSVNNACMDGCLYLSSIIRCITTITIY